MIITGKVRGEEEKINEILRKAGIVEWWADALPSQIDEIEITDGGTLRVWVGGHFCDPQWSLGQMGQTKDDALLAAITEFAEDPTREETYN